MRSIGSFSLARIAYLAVVSSALVTVSVRTFAGNGNEPSVLPPLATDAAVTTGPDTTVLVIPTGDTAAAASTPTTRAPSGRPSSQGKSSNTVPAPGTVPAVTTTVTTVAPTTSHQSSPTISPTTTRVPGPTTTSTTIYRPGSIVLTIPLGTRARMDRGEDVSDVLPLTLNVRVGQYIYLVNKDDYFYSYGPMNVMPQDVTPYFFSTSGTSTGFCSIARTSVTFNVTP